MTANNKGNSHCHGTAALRHRSFPRWSRVIAGLLLVLLASQLAGCQQGNCKAITAASQKPIVLPNRRSGLLKALLIAGGYASDPNFRPRKPIVRRLWDISQGQQARVAVLISGGPDFDLKGIVALLGGGDHVTEVLRVKGCIAFLRTVKINCDNRGPDSILLLTSDGSWPDASINRYHLITLVNGQLRETFSAKGDSWSAILGEPPMDWITSLATVSVPTSRHFNCLCLFRRWFGASQGVSAKLWRWNPRKLRFAPLTNREIGGVNADVLRWSRGVKW